MVKTSGRYSTYMALVFHKILPALLRGLTKRLLMYDFARVIRFVYSTGVWPTLLIFVTATTEETGSLTMSDYIVFSCQLISCFCSTVRIYCYANKANCFCCLKARIYKTQEACNQMRVIMYFLARLVSSFLTNEFFVFFSFGVNSQLYVLFSTRSNGLLITTIIIRCGFTLCVS